MRRQRIRFASLTLSSFKVWSVTIVDSLDMMVLMGLVPQDMCVLKFIAGLNVTTRSQSVHLFETVISYLGGFVSARRAPPCFPLTFGSSARITCTRS